MFFARAIAASRVGKLAEAERDLKMALMYEKENASMRALLAQVQAQLQPSAAPATGAASPSAEPPPAAQAKTAAAQQPETAPSSQTPKKTVGGVPASWHTKPRPKT
jgi:hypothetical protein